MTRSLTIIATLTATACIALTVALGSTGGSGSGSASAQNRYAYNECNYLAEMCKNWGGHWCIDYFNKCRTTPKPPSAF